MGRSVGLIAACTFPPNSSARFVFGGGPTGAFTCFPGSVYKPLWDAFATSAFRPLMVERLSTVPTEAEKKFASNMALDELRNAETENDVLHAIQRLADVNAAGVTKKHVIQVALAKKSSGDLWTKAV